MKKSALLLVLILSLAFCPAAFAATNPFMDVPASHWAYDAVAQLASRGVISGYPDGSYKGAQPATRYEMASIVARAIARIDMEKADKQDVEMLKKLIVEFKDELDALGVKVDRIDDRLAVLERDLGGWHIAGEFRFDAKFAQEEGSDWYADDYEYSGKNQFDLDRYRLWFTKRINETTRFTARIGRGDGNGVEWEHYYITTMLPWDITLHAGLQNIDWEDELGLYADNAPMFGDWEFNMFLFERDWGIANLKFLVGRLNDAAWDADDPSVDSIERFMVAGMANFDINERFRAGLIAYYSFADEEVRLPGGTSDTDTDLGIYGLYAGYSFIPGVELKGLYYYQTQGDTIARELSGTTNFDDNANAWKLMLEVDQDVLKFTSVWLEYGQIDNNFATNDRMADGLVPGFGDSIGAYTYLDGGASLLKNMPFNTNTSKVYGIRLDQEWNDKWRTYARYFAADHDTSGVDDATNWSLGVAYRLNDAVEFELVYDKIDYGTGAGNERNGDDDIVRFRTFVTF